MKKFIRFGIIFSLAFNVSAQQSTKENQECYIFYDKVIGIENTSLYNGSRYYDIDPSNLKQHKFFESSQYTLGNVVYNQKPFYNVLLKYDLFNNKLICKPTGTQSFLDLELKENEIDSFSINNHNFSHIKHINNDYNKTFIFLEEVLKTNEFVFYLNHKKILKKRIKNKKTIKKYTIKIDYYLYINTILYKINSRNSIVKLLPNHKKQINTFFDDYKALLKTDKTAFMSKLFGQLKK